MWAILLCLYNLSEILGPELHTHCWFLLCASHAACISGVQVLQMNNQFCWFPRKCVSLIDTSILSTFPFLYIYIEVSWLQPCFIDHKASHATWACMVFANPDHHIQQFKLCFALKFWVKYSSESTLPLDKKISMWNKDLNQQKGVPMAKFTRKRFISRRKKKSLIACVSLERPLLLTVSLLMSVKPLEIKLKSVGLLLSLRLHERWLHIQLGTLSLLGSLVIYFF